MKSLNQQNRSTKPFLNIMLAASIGLAGSLVPNVAHSADEGSSSTPSCKRGHAWDKRKSKCVKVKKSSNFTDENIYEVARNLAYETRYDEALVILRLAKDQSDPRILNYLGYSTRKSGDVKKGLTYYQAAIKADPNYTLARSYMGEAYLQLGDRSAAYAQLAEIKLRCKGSCPEYTALENKILGKKPAKNTQGTW
jgi:tetratricopeptide (TPR) repeat protein